MQVRDNPLDLLRHALQKPFPFHGDGIAAVQRFVDASVDLCQLLRGKKGAAEDQPGAGGEVPLCGGVSIDARIGAVVVSLIQCGPILHSLPSDELDSVLGGVSCQDGVVELR